MAALAKRSKAHREPRDEDIQPLTKTEAIRVAAAEEKLRPFQDEKLELYNVELGNMSQAFVEAREGRGVLAAIYEARNKEVLDRLIAMRARTDREARKHLDSLKAFSKEFDESASDMKKGFKRQFAGHRHEITGRQTAISETIASLNAAIVQENEDCIAQASAETEPIQEALARHNDFLATQVAERGEEHDRFSVDMKDRFAKLRRKIAEESEARTTQGVEIRQQADQRYAELDEQLREKEPKLKKSMEGIRVRLAVELEERAVSQGLVVANMMNFMAEFEKSIAEAVQRQEKTKAHMMKMKEVMREEADS